MPGPADDSGASYPSPSKDTTSRCSGKAVNSRPALTAGRQVLRRERTPDLGRRIGRRVRQRTARIATAVRAGCFPLRPSGRPRAAGRTAAGTWYAWSYRDDQSDVPRGISLAPRGTSSSPVWQPSNGRPAARGTTSSVLVAGADQNRAATVGMRRLVASRSRLRDVRRPRSTRRGSDSFLAWSPLQPIEE
jgi:hypothetical protein